MKITITVENDEGEVTHSATALSIDRAFDEMYALERFVKREADKADVMAESLSEEAI